MGIKKIHNILKKYAPNAYQQVHISNYYLKKIAIDVSLYLFRSKARAKSRYQEDQWPSEFIYLISCLRKNNVHPVFIYDTKAPVEKKGEREKRAEKRQSQRDRILAIENSLKKYIETGEADELLIEICEQLMSEDSEKSKRFLRKDKNTEKKVEIDIKAVNEKIKKLKSQIIEVCENDFKLTREIFDILNVPYLYAPGEAEAMCCYLNMHGFVDAVLSEDTDVLAYGCTKFLTKLDTVNETVIEIDSSIMLDELKMTQETFLDLCIMCGTDYNTNVKGLGPEKSFDLIKNYESIEKIGEIIDKKTGDKKFDISVLNHNRTRELFKIPEKINIKIDYTGNPDFVKLENFLKTHNLNTQIQIIKKSFEKQKIQFV